QDITQIVPGFGERRVHLDHLSVALRCCLFLAEGVEHVRQIETHIRVLPSREERLLIGLGGFVKLPGVFVNTAIIEPLLRRAGLMPDFDAGRFWGFLELKYDLTARLA